MENQNTNQPLEKSFMEFAQKYSQYRITDIFEHLLNECIYLASNPRILQAEHDANAKMYAPNDLSFLVACIEYHSVNFRDGLGDLYMFLSGSGHKSHLGQFFTPELVSDMCARIAQTKTIAPQQRQKRIFLADITGCGTGRNILALSKTRAGNNNKLTDYHIGMDLDKICVLITAYNFWANYCAGCVVKGDSLESVIDRNKVEYGFKIQVFCFCNEATNFQRMNIPFIQALTDEELTGFCHLLGYSDKDAQAIAETPAKASKSSKKANPQNELF